MWTPLLSAGSTLVPVQDPTATHSYTTALRGAEICKNCSIHFAKSVAMPRNLWTSCQGFGCGMLIAEVLQESGTGPFDVMRSPIKVSFGTPISHLGVRPDFPCSRYYVTWYCLSHGNAGTALLVVWAAMMRPPTRLKAPSIKYPRPGQTT